MGINVFWKRSYKTIKGRNLKFRPFSYKSLYFFDVPISGRVKEICGLDILQNNPNVLRYELRFKVGETICRANNDSARVGYYIAYSENKKALREMMDMINNTFKIIVE